MTSPLGRLMAPRAVALLGVPGDPERPGARPLRFLRRHGFAGPIYLVNPRHREIDGLPVVPSLEDLPGPVDVVWVGLPARDAPGALRAAGRAGARFAVVLGAGFAEAGPEGEGLQAALVEAARDTGVRVVGPNTVGFVNAWDRVALTFSTVGELERLDPGPLAILSQSGGTGGLLLNQAVDRRLGAGLLVSAGNEADLDLADYLDWLVEDGRARAVACVVEQVRRPERFAAAARRALDRGLSVTALKLGGTSSGARAARSHTGALVGGHDAWRAWAREIGIVVVDTPEQLLCTTAYLARTPPPGGSRVGMVTSSGGIAVLLADALEPRGLTLGELTPETGERLARLVPAYAALGNPVDVTAGLPDATFGEALRAVVNDPGIDLLVVPLTMATAEGGRARARAVADALRGAAKPAAVCWPGGSLVEPGRRLLDEAGIPLFRDAEGCAVALAGSLALQAARAHGAGERPAAPALPRLPLLAPEAGALGWPELRAVLVAAGLPVAPDAVVHTAGEARIAADGLGYPVALKGLAHLHKSDAGGVRLGLGDGDAVERAFAAVGTGPAGCLVQPMIEGLEVLVGALRDPALGPFVLLSPGGTRAELYRERALRSAPCSVPEAARLVEECPALRRLLAGYRGSPAGDLGALIEVVAAVSRLAAALGPRLTALDLNPVLVGRRGAWIVDGRILLEAAPGER